MDDQLRRTLKLRTKVDKYDERFNSTLEDISEDSDLATILGNISISPAKTEQETTLNNNNVVVPRQIFTLAKDYTQKALHNDELIKSCLEVLRITIDWDLMTDGYYTTKLEEYSSEYQNAAMHFENIGSSLHIVNIQKIVNPFLLISYHLTKYKYIQVHGNVSEKHLFHGTWTSSLKSICSNNFDWRLNGTSKGHKFGQGVSFSPDSYYSSHYGNKSVMILAAVLVSKSSLGNCLTIVPPGDTDTTVNSKLSVYVKYDDNTFYPKYIIKYGRS